MGPGRRAFRRTLLIVCVVAGAVGFAGRSRAQDATTATIEPGTASFNVFLRSTPIGVERVEVARLDDGWLIRSGGELGAPLNQQNDLFEVEYDLEWRPRRLAMDGTGGGQPFSLRSTFEDGRVSSTVTVSDDPATSVQQIDPTSVVLPDYFFGAYEAAAARLDGVETGDVLPVYVAPRGQTTARIREVRLQELETAERRLAARIFRLTFEYPERPLDAEVWIDARRRLLRVFIPALSLDVARQDISLVSTRLTGMTVPGDTGVRIPASGFSLAGTLTIPTTRERPTGGWPLVVLVPGTQSTGRDEHLEGLPLHGRIAEGLAAAGYAVFRYDRRGVGQSGGRPESAGLDDYAQDVRDVVRFLRDRDDIDPDRVAVVAHGEGGWIGLDAASREDRIGALALVATPSTPGTDWVLERQAAELTRLEVPPAERDERIALQRRINEAVLDDGTWDGIPPHLRTRADTRWFETWLDFEPAAAMRRTRQPILILHGDRDRQIPPDHASRLASLAAERDRRESTVDLAVLTGVDHRLVAGEPDPDPERADSPISPDAISTLVGWLDRTLPVER